MKIDTRKATHCFIDKHRYFNPEEFTQITDDQQIREIASLETHKTIDKETGEVEASKYFPYTRELQLVHAGKMKFLIRNDQPYLNEKVYKKEMTALLKDIKSNKDVALILSYKLFGGPIKKMSKFKDIAYMVLKENWEQSLKEKDNF